MRYTFASDNTSGAHPRILDAVTQAYAGSVASYGTDAYTLKAQTQLRELLGKHVRSWFVLNGTAANVLGLSAMLRPYHAVICSPAAHLYTDEGGAPERWLGCKLMPVPHQHGKLSPEAVAKALGGRGDVHRVQPRVLTISQPTEYGTLYSVEELKALGTFCKANGLLFHVDGARISNAAAAIDQPLGSWLAEAGVDVLSFGGAKNGLMIGEAVVLLNPDLAHDFDHLHKQALQLASKNRLLGAQFSAFLADGLWLELATHANQKGQELAAVLTRHPQIELVCPVQTNALFMRMPLELAGKLWNEFMFYPWGDGEFRMMTSWSTTDQDIADVARLLGV